MDKGTLVREVQFRRLDSLVESLGHAKRAVDILKIDVEGSEYDVLYAAGASDVLRRVGQLQIEVHTTGGNTSTREQVLGLYARMRAAGLRLFNKELNHWVGLTGSCAEWSLVGPAHAFRSFRMSHPSCRA